MDIDGLKEHIDSKFKNHEEMDSLRHSRINELLANYSREIEHNEETIKRVHTRVDRIETKIKTVTGVGTTIATILGGVAAWIELRKVGDEI